MDGLASGFVDVFDEESESQVVSLQEMCVRLLSLRYEHTDWVQIGLPPDLLLRIKCHYKNRTVLNQMTTTRTQQSVLLLRNKKK